MADVKQISPNPNPAGNYLPHSLPIDDPYIDYVNDIDYINDGVIYCTNFQNNNTAGASFTNNGHLNLGSSFNVDSSLVSWAPFTIAKDGQLWAHPESKIINYNAMTVSGKGLNPNIYIAQSCSFFNSWVQEGPPEERLMKGILCNSGSITNEGTLTNEESATIDNKPGALIANQIGDITRYASELINNGTLNNDGTIDNTGGGSFINTSTGTYSGSGQILGSWTDHGVVKAGNSAGGMFVDGHYYKKGGSKEIELGGIYHGDGDRTATEHDWIEITGDLELAGNLDVSLIDGFKLSAGDSFVITKVDGDLSGEYDGLDEGDSVGRFKSEKGGKLDLFLTYEGGDGNDIELYTKSFFSVLPDSLRDPRIIGSDDKDSLTGTSADEVIFGGSDDDVLLGGAGDDQVTGGNGNDKLDGGLGDDTLKGDRGADDYILSSGEDIYESFSIDENDQVVVGEGVDLSFQQVGDNLLIKGIAIHTTLLDVDKDEFLAADCIDYI
ncbi:MULTISPECIES: calcium-binding protein [unclassified Prochlorococcus]|uniref:calcium-binding protein n=1 Tax=unclassified Prochlorococcus TaxID=2627481 RepID=UPI0039A48333